MQGIGGARLPRLQKRVVVLVIECVRPEQTAAWPAIPTVESAGR